VGMEYIRKAIYTECDLWHVMEERQIHKEKKGILGRSLKACFPIAQTLVLWILGRSLKACFPIAQTLVL
jgi:hypothetical protein